MIDSADCFCWWEDLGWMGGHSEALLGRWFADAGTRRSVFLATKATAMLTDLEGVFPDDGGPAS